MASKQRKAKPTGAPMMEIQNVQLETFEKAVYSRNYELASHELLMSLRKLKAGAEFIGYPVDPESKVVLFTRYCSAIFTMMADPAYSMSQEGFDAIASEHAIMDMVWRCSIYGTSDHMLPQMALDPTEKDQAKIRFADSAGVAKFMLTYSMRSGFLMNFKEAFGKNPQIMFSLYVGFLTNMIALSATAEERREVLLGMFSVFEDINMGDQLISSLSDAYMYCSYAHRRDKHQFKGLIHRLYSRMMYNHGFKDIEFPQLRQLKDRPTILIPVEWFTSLHAMYRCYAPIMRQLKKRFKLIGIGRPHAIDETAKDEFHAWIEVPEIDVVLSEVIERIKALKPDIIYYPSIGMDMVWVALASIRLAPIQLMTLGHPASSQSPCIDYAICEQGEVRDKSLFTEKVVELPPDSLFHFVMRPDAELPIAKTVTNPEVIKIAVPAMILKLNATFMSTLREIALKAKRPTEFHFFPNMITSTLMQIARELREWLPNCCTYERSQYNHYLTQMGACHIQLGTFPFGGTNSNIDAMLLGMPSVVMEGDEPHETCDAKMLRRAGLPEWLIAHTREEYIAAAVRLIDNDVERCELSRHLIEDADIHGRFLCPAPAELKTAFSDAVWKIYQEHKS